MNLHKIMRKICYDIGVAMKLKNIQRKNMYLVFSKELKEEFEKDYLLLHDEKQIQYTVYGINVLVDHNLKGEQYRVMYNELGG